jgi:hypothetical protein
MTATRPDVSLPLAPEWYRHIAEAASLRDLVLVVRSFLDGWSPVDLARLPPTARPGRMVDAEDIVAMAYDLSRARLKGDLPHDIDRLATRMQTFFSHAAARAAMLSTHRDT